MRGAVKGQFSIIAAALLAIILISAVAITYSIINFSLPKEQTNVSSSVYEINNSLKQMMEFAVGYYCSVLQVTGNSSFAQSLARNYLSSGFEFIANSHPELNPSIRISDMNFSVRWYEASSYSMGYLKASYDLLSLRLSSINYDVFCALRVEIIGIMENKYVKVNVTQDESRPYLGLDKANFHFYYYSNASSKWVQEPTTNCSIIENSVYRLGIPDGINENCFLLEVSDTRGITTISFYSTRKKPQITYVFDWNATGMQSIYTQLKNDKIVVEILQNGTLLWLGQKLLHGYPIPQLPIKCLRVSANADPNHLEAKQIPFQVEDWASNYKVPLGRSNSETLFSSRNMIVFLVDHSIKNVTIWWDGRDNAQQTPYSTMKSFNDKIVSASGGGAVAVLNNGVTRVNITYNSGNGIFYVKTATSRADFMQINGHSANFYASPSFPIINGTIRDIIQQEAEWSGYNNWGFPNTYAQIVLTFPANATYYTYALRLIFVNASTCPENRVITNLTPLTISSDWKTKLKVLTENGTSNGIPLTVETYVGSYAFYNFSDGKWQHHWTQYNYTSNTGAGIMFNDFNNKNLYLFDNFIGQKTGVLNVATTQSPQWITPKTVYNRCSESGSNVAANSIDGSTSTYWRHDSTCYHWIIYDLGEPMNISRVRIYQGQYDWGSTAGINIYVSNDSQNWGSAVWTGRIDGDNQWVASGQFQAQGRYIKLESRSNSASQRLIEVQVEVQQRSTTIELSPIRLRQVSFRFPLDVTWFGAVVTIESNTDFIYGANGVGLWVVVDHPPKVEAIA
ncbi:MAG: discoidin domain-containing protein [Candidatus Bathyarchaeia archaeon]